MLDPILKITKALKRVEGVALHKELQTPVLPPPKDIK
jgi:hypothetical protein